MQRSDHADDTLLLCYHAVSDEWPSVLSVRPASFEHQLELILDRGYRGVTFADAVSGADGRVVAVTFDDGFRSVAEVARPILDRLGVPATIFVTTDFVGQDAAMSWTGISQWLGGPYERELLPVSWEQLRALMDAGWEVGSHTRSHPRLTELTDDQLADELGESRAACEASLGKECRSLAYPYSGCDERVAEATRAAGYSAAAMLVNRIPATDAIEWPRIGVYRGDGIRAFRLKASPLIRWLRRTPMWTPLTIPLRRWQRRRAIPS